MDDFCGNDVMLFSLAVWTMPAQAADRVVVIPMGNHGAPVAKTGQTRQRHIKQVTMGLCKKVLAYRVDLKTMAMAR